MNESTPIVRAATAKRSDQMADDIKRWLISKALSPGDRLPKEVELAALFGVGKGTAREALKSLEVQGLVTLRTGPDGGATLVEAPFDRTFQLVQNYLFFREVDVDAIYGMRRLLEPELVAGAIPHLTPAAIDRLAGCIDCCAPTPRGAEQALQQRREDLNFHDIIAEAHPNPLLRFVCQLMNEMLRRMTVFGGGAAARAGELGRTNVAAHRLLLDAIRACDADRARALMLAHVIEAEGHVRKLNGALDQRLVLDSDLRVRVAAPAARKERSA